AGRQLSGHSAPPDDPGQPEDLAACGLRAHQQVTVQGEVAAEATAPLRSRCHHGGAGRRRQ
ncbi:MAG: hypothetical protein O2977_02795, partial [Cyanobacteria bacterium]|nr:hypothetical protein [Cyanobacteriota bacterium]